MPHGRGFDDFKNKQTNKTISAKTFRLTDS